MKVVHTDRLSDDMVLSEDVIDDKGKLLLAKGNKIKSKHIRILKIWGVTEITVAGDDNEEEIPESNPDNEQIEEDTRYVFKHVDLNHPAINELFRLSVFYRVDNGILETKSNEVLIKYNDSKNDVFLKTKGKILEDKIQLPEIPPIILELNAVIENPLSTADDIGRVVYKSPSLTALLLKVANSPVFGFSSKIDTISRAVTIIGTKEIIGLAVGISTINSFKDIPKEIIDIHSFLRHSFACGIISRILAARKDIPQTEQLFVLGLLHDIGRLIICQSFPDQAGAMICSCIKSGRLLSQEENNYIGCKHTDIGRYLLQKWNFPFSLENNLFYHHNPSQAHDPLQAAIVHLADIIVNGLGIGSSGERFVPPLDYDAWDGLGLSPSVFEVVIGQAIHQLEAIDTFLN